MKIIIPVHFEIEAPDADDPYAWAGLVIVNDETGERRTIISESTTDAWATLTYALERGLKEASLHYD